MNEVLKKWYLFCNSNPILGILCIGFLFVVLGIPILFYELKGEENAPP